MKKMVVVAVLALGLVLMSMPVLALPLGTNITIDDENTHDGEWYGNYEDNEVEWHSVANQSWDLEGFFLDGTTLSMVGGWDFVSGQSGYTSGDVFIDVDGVDFTLSVDDDYGYDYAFDVNWSEGTYTLNKLAGSTYSNTTYVGDSNPWRYKSNGTQVGSGTFSTDTLTEAEATALGLAGDGYGQSYSNVHNVVSFDLLPILTNLGVSKIDFTSHFTMECGNDNLMGHGTAPVPEPQTLLLMGIGLLGLAFVGRKKMGDRA